MNSVVQTEACSVTTEIQSGSMSMVTTTLVSVDEGFCLPIWLGNLLIKKTKSKSLKD